MGITEYTLQDSDHLRKLIRERGLHAKVKGTGKGGAIKKIDLATTLHKDDQARERKLAQEKAQAAESNGNGEALRQDADDDNDLVGEVDARVWARRFVERVAAQPQIATDEGTMLAWFSTAIMAGVDSPTEPTGYHRKSLSAEAMASDAPPLVFATATGGRLDVMSPEQAQDVEFGMFDEVQAGRFQLTLMRIAVALETLATADQPANVSALQDEIEQLRTALAQAQAENRRLRTLVPDDSRDLP